MTDTRPDARNNAAFNLTYHLVLVTKYRHKALSPQMLARAEGILAEVLRDWRCEMIEFGGEADHLHLLFRGHPAMELSRLVNNLKTVSSRLLRKEFAEHLAKFYWKPVLWHGAYYVGTVGHASLETVRRYVESQGRGRWPGRSKTGDLPA